MKMYGIARFAEDPVLKFTDNNVAVAEFAIAWNERRKVADKVVDNVHFLDCVIWAQAAELVAKEYKKGDAIFIESATPRQDRWVDKEGKNRSRVIFRIDSFKFVPRPKNRTEEESQVLEEVAS